VARAVMSDPERRAALEPLYHINPRTGATIEIFYGDPVLAASFGAPAGWFWWSCERDFPPGPATGPFPNSYLAYRDSALNKGLASIPARLTARP
jgi:hypothetical protein